MKTSLLALVLIATPAFAQAPLCIPSGTYSGKGVTVSADGTRTPYTSTLVLQEGSATFTETCEKGTESYTFDFNHQGNDFFSVSFQGKEIGQGYCIGQRCHYDVTVNGRHIEQTFVHEHEMIDVVGSVTQDGKVTRFSEELNKE